MDKLVRVTTIDAARNLPEVESQYWTFRNETLPSGETVIHRDIRPFSVCPIYGDQILFFTDEDGRGMKVIYTENGPAKTPFSI